MKCPNCDSVIPDASNFCGVCGADLRAVEEAPAVSNQTVVLSSMSTAVDSPSYSSEANAGAAEAAAAEPESKEPEAPATTNVTSNPVDDAASQNAAPEVAEPLMQPATQIDSSGASPSSNVEASAQPSLPPVEVGGSISGSPDEQAGGGFRETLWFMQAQDPDSLEAIQNEDHNLESLNENYEDDGNVLDTQVRQQFSLNISGEAAAKLSAEQNVPSAGPDMGVDDDIESPADNRGKMIAAVVVVLVIIGGVVLMM